jgi:NAD(P)H-hydrate epimerase
MLRPAFPVPSARKIDPDVLAELPLPDYDHGASKSVRGKLLLVGGSVSLPGAALLAAKAALRSGCGTVRVAAPEQVAMHLAIAVPELMVLALPGDDGWFVPAALEAIRAQYEACQALVIGPGLEASDASAEVVRTVVAEAPLPTVVDAQALYDWHQCDAARSGRYAAGAGPRVFTPHPGELAAILGDEGQPDDRIDLARWFAAERGGTLVMKDARTLIADPEGRLFENRVGTRALGTAGSGDVLAGILGGLLAQGMTPTAAGVWAVHLHALCGVAGAREIGEDGLLATDLLDRLPLVLRDLRRAAGATRHGRSSPRRGPASPARRTRSPRSE